MRHSTLLLNLFQAEYYRLPEMIKLLMHKGGQSLPPLSGGGHSLLTPQTSISRSITNLELCERTGSITVGYRGTFAFGRDGLVDVKFRKVNRILVCGKVIPLKRFSKILLDVRILWFGYRTITVVSRIVLARYW